MGKEESNESSPSGKLNSSTLTSLSFHELIIEHPFGARLLEMPIRMGLILLPSLSVMMVISAFLEEEMIH